MEKRTLLQRQSLPAAALCSRRCCHQQRAQGRTGQGGASGPSAWKTALAPLLLLPGRGSKWKHTQACNCLECRSCD